MEDTVMYLYDHTPVPASQAHASYCVRCGDPLLSGISVCTECRNDIWEWAKSFGEDAPATDKRVYARITEFRLCKK